MVLMLAPSCVLVMSLKQFTPATLFMQFYPNQPSGPDLHKM
jgi:hypothetical protein